MEMAENQKLDLSVLVVEDEVSTLEEIGIFLKRRLRDVHTAQDGRSGLAVFGERRPDLIITDIRMPFMDGLEMVRQIRLTDRDVPVIIMTAHTDFSLVAEAIDTGIDGYILKPVDHEKLANIVRRCAGAIETGKLAEKFRQEMLKREEQYTMLVNNLPDAMLYQIIRHEDGRRIFSSISGRVRQMYGCSPEEAMADPALIYDRIFEGDRERIFNEEEAAFRSLLTFSTEVRMYNPDGSVRWSLFRSQPRMLEDGSSCWDGVELDITQRKKAESEAAEHAAMVKQIMDTANVGIALVDKNGIFTHVNRYMAEMVGEGIDEMTGSRYIDYVHPDERNSAGKNMLALMSGEIETAHIDRRYIKKDGSFFWGHLTCNRFCDAQGNYIGLIGVISDITDRKETEVKIRLSEERFRSIYENIGIGIAVIGKNMEILSVNPVMQRWFPDIESSKKPLCYRSFNNPPGDAVCSYCPTVRTFNDGKVHISVTETPSPDGSRNYQIVSSPLFDENGSVSAVIEMVEDITESRCAEDKIRQNERFIRGILDSVDEGFIVVDPEYRIVTANRAYCSQAGYSCDDIIGKNCYRISHKISRPCYEAGEECAVRSVFETGEPSSVSHKHFDSEGNVVYVETKAYPMKNDEGRVVSVIETLTNITEKHLLEEERLKSQKLESIGTLAGGIAHDFNNLLQGVFGYISLAKLNADNRAKNIAALDEAEKALHLTVKLTNQLLTFSKGGKPVMKPVDIRQITENAIRFALSGSRSDCRLTVSEDSWDAEADDGQIGQVIQNILLNADQAMPEGGLIRIDIRNVSSPGKELPPELKPGDYVEISIKDSGIGIPKQYLPKIFDPYFTTKEKGSGLGLATSYSIVRNHGGLITVSSTPGEGSTFTIYVPAVRKVTAEEPSVPVIAETRKSRILVMDDEEVVRMIVGELLRALGHEVEFAEHGDAALLLYQQARGSGRPFDAVILDLTIRGGMGGEETIRRLLAMDPEVKAIVSSGYSDDAVIANYGDYGFRSYLKKPFRVEQLSEVINSVLS